MREVAIDGVGMESEAFRVMSYARSVGDAEFGGIKTARISHLGKTVLETKMAVTVGGNMI